MPVDDNSKRDGQNWNLILEHLEWPRDLTLLIRFYCVTRHHTAITSAHIREKSTAGVHSTPSPRSLDRSQVEYEAVIAVSPATQLGANGSTPQLFCGCPVAPPKLSLGTRLAVCDCVSNRAPTSSWTVHNLCQVSLRCRRALGLLPHQHIACRHSTTRITLSAFPVACSLPYLAFCVHPSG